MLLIVVANRIRICVRVVSKCVCDMWQRQYNTPQTSQIAPQYLREYDAAQCIIIIIFIIMKCD